MTGKQPLYVRRLDQSSVFTKQHGHTSSHETSVIMQKARYVHHLLDKSVRKMTASRGSSRSQMAPTASPGGSVVGRSLSECTTKSTSFDRSNTSSSFVKRFLVPIFDNATLSTLSPMVSRVCSYTQHVMCVSEVATISSERIWGMREYRTPQYHAGKQNLISTNATVPIQPHA